MQAASSASSSAPQRPISNHPPIAPASGMRDLPHAAHPRDRMPSISPLQPEANAPSGEPGRTLIERWLSWGRRHLGQAGSGQSKRVADRPAHGPSPAARAWPRGLGFAALPAPIVMQLAGYLSPEDIGALSRVEPHCRRLLGAMAFRHGIDVRSDRAVTPSNLDAVLRDSDRLPPGPRSEVLVRVGRSIRHMPPALSICAALSLLCAVERLPAAARPAPLGTVALAMLSCDEFTAQSAVESRRQLYRRVQEALMDLSVPLRVDALSVVLRDIPSQRLSDPSAGNWVTAMVASVLEVGHVWTLRSAARPQCEAPRAFRDAEQALQHAIAALPPDTPEALLTALAVPGRPIQAQTVTRHYQSFLEFAACHQGSTAALAYIAAAQLLPWLPTSQCMFGWHGVIAKLAEVPGNLRCWLLESLGHALPELPPGLQVDYWLAVFGLTMAHLPSPGERYIALRQLCRALGAIVAARHVDLSTMLIEASAEQALPFRPVLLHLALVSCKPTTPAWRAAFGHVQALEYGERHLVLQALAMTLDTPSDSGAAWDAILAMAHQLPVTEQGAVLSALANAMVHLSRQKVEPALRRLLEAARHLPRQDGVGLLALLAQLVLDSKLSRLVFQAIQQLPRLDRPLPLGSLAGNVERLHPAMERPAAWQRTLEATLALHPNDRLLPLRELDSTRRRLSTLAGWLADWQWKRQASALPRLDAIWLTGRGGPALS